MTTANGEGFTANQLRELSTLLTNVYASRTELFKYILSSKRDIDKECDYPASESGWVDPEVYRVLYEREAVAARVVQVVPKESWVVQPRVYEAEDPETITPFERAWNEIGRTLLGQTSYYAARECNPVWEYLYRVDVQSGICACGALFMGFDDGLDFSQSVRGIEEGNSSSGSVSDTPLPRYTFSTNVKETRGRKLLYLRVFPEYLFTIDSYETNPTSPRYGMPVMYSMTFDDPVHGPRTGTQLTGRTRKVHWTRVIHVADNLEASEIFGTPRMRPVLNRILDLRKLYSGSAEMYWKGAFPGIVVKTQPSLGGETDIDRPAAKDMMEKWQEGLKRMLLLENLDAEFPAPQVVDPLKQISAQLEAICIQLNIPLRIFKGSERGELASSQDQKAWQKRMGMRQMNYLTPRLIVPFVDRLILAGVLPEPISEEGTVTNENVLPESKTPYTTSSNRGYSIYWPDMAAMTDQERADYALKTSQALAQYVTGGGQKILAPKDFFVRSLGIEEREVSSVIANAEEHAKKVQSDELSQAREKIKQGLVADPTEPPSDKTVKSGGNMSNPSKPGPGRPSGGQ